MLDQNSPSALAKVLMLESTTRLLTRKQAADFLGVKEQTLACWACTHRYDLPIIKVGRLVKYHLHDLQDFILKNRVSKEG